MPMRAPLPRFLLLMTMFIVLPVDAATTPIAKPTGRVMLAVSGKIQRNNSENGVEFDRSMLEAIGMVELTTETRRSSKAKPCFGVCGCVIS